MNYFFKRKNAFQAIFISIIITLNSVGANKAFAFSCFDQAYDLVFEQIDAHHFKILTEIRLSSKNIWDSEQINLIYYPKRYEEKLPYLHDLNYHRIYPQGFQAIDMKIISVHVDGHEKKWIWNADVIQRFGQTLFSIKLNVQEQASLKNKESIILKIESELKVPEKFGGFGAYRQQVSLLSSWYPYVQDDCQSKQASQSKEKALDYLPRSTPAKVTLKTQYPVLLRDQYFSAQTELKTAAFDQASELTLRTGPKLRVKQFKNLPWLKFYHYKHLSGSFETSLKVLATDWENYVKATPQLTMPTAINMAQTPLRNFLVQKSESVALVSDRLFKLNSFLHKYHNIPVIQSWFYQMFIATTQKNESIEDSRWVADALAWYWTSQFLENIKFNHIDARKMPLLKNLSFLPVVDLLIYSPQFAFVDTFYNNPYPWDYNRDDPIHYYDARTWGRTLVEKMYDWLGKEPTENILNQYLQQDAPLKTLAEKVSEKNLDAAYQQWQFRPPSVNYKIARKKSKKTTEQQYLNYIKLSKDAKEQFKEPVEILVVDKAGKNYHFTWFDEKPKHEIEFESKAKLKRVYLDPRSRLLERQRYDNTKPAPYKFVLEEMFLDYDVNERVPLVFLGGTIRKTLGGNNRYRITGSYFGESYGFGLGYSRLFGRAVDGLRLSHGLSTSVNFSRVTDDSVLLDNGSVVPLTQASNISSVGMSYFFGNQLSFTNPLSGGGGVFFVSLGNKVLGGEHSYLQLGHSASWVFPLTINHLLAFRYSVSGASSGVPSQVQYRLGGIAAIKGIAFNDERFQGRYQFVTSAEYRHFIKQDIDVNLGLFRIRDVQGAIFLDAGHVTATVQEQAEKKIDPGAQSTDLGDLLNFTDFTYGAGYGLRFHIDYFGVNPSVLRIDAARTLDDQHGGVKLYLGVGQSF